MLNIFTISFEMLVIHFCSLLCFPLLSFRFHAVVYYWNGTLHWLCFHASTYNGHLALFWNYAVKNLRKKPVRNEDQTAKKTDYLQLKESYRWQNERQLMIVAATGGTWRCKCILFMYKIPLYILSINTVIVCTFDISIFLTLWLS